MKKGNKNFAEGRKCTVCGTTLNIYNPGPNCYAHQSGHSIQMRSQHPVTRSTRAGSPVMRGSIQLDDWGY